MQCFQPSLSYHLSKKEYREIVRLREESVNGSILSPLLVAFACFGRDGWVRGWVKNYQNIQSELDAI